jgi:hypothetical protein
MTPELEQGNMNSARKPIKVFFTMVHTPTGVKRVGDRHRTRKDAQDWAPFVSGAWHGMRVSVRGCLITFGPDGKPDAKSRERLDKEFNAEVRS